MLVLPVQSVGDVIVLRDDALADRAYVALKRPRVARDAGGGPRLRLLRWVAQADEAARRVVGARLTLDVDLAPTAAQIAAAGLGPVTAMPLPWLDASVRLEGPQFEPIVVEVAVAGSGVAALAVDLTPEAASVLAPLLEGDNVMPLQVTWTGHVRVRLPAVEVIATSDVNEVRRRLTLAGATRQTVMTRSIIEANVKIEIKGTDNAALEAALRDWVLDELARRFALGQPLSVHAAASDVVSWPITLATTLDDLVPPAARRTLVETIVLDAADAGARPPVAVRVLGDFAGRLERVDVRLQPQPGDAVTELAVTDESPRAVALPTDDFRWAYRTKLDGRAAAPWSAWADGHGRNLVIAVATPAVATFEVVAMGLDFGRRWASVSVAVELSSPDAPPVTHTVELDASHLSRTFTQALDGVRGSLRARLTYLSRYGEKIERQIDDIAGDQIVVGDPLDGDVVRIAVVPAGTGWGDVALAMVDLRYAGDGHVVDETVELRKLDDFVQWEAPARAGGPRTIQWRVHASFNDGRFESRPWQTSDTGVAVVRIDAAPRRTVQIFPLHFDPALLRQGSVRLRAASQVETVVVDDRVPRTVNLPPGPFTWTVAWTAADGTALPESAAQEGDDVIVLPRYRPNA